MNDMVRSDYVAGHIQIASASSVCLSRCITDMPPTTEQHRWPEKGTGVTRDISQDRS